MRSRFLISARGRRDAARGAAGHRRRRRTPASRAIRPSREPWETSPRRPPRPHCGAHFCVHWAAFGVDAPSRADRDGDGIPDYVERVLAVAENVHHVENEVLGWPAPLGDGTRGGGHDKTDIYLTELAGEQVFGYTATDPGRNRPRRRARRAAAPTSSSTTTTATSTSRGRSRGATSR